MTNEKGECVNTPQGNAAGVNVNPQGVGDGRIIASFRLNGQGARLRIWRRWSGKLPEKGRGEIAGWSLASRRRFRDLLLRLRAPDGWAAYSVTLTVPPLPVGHPSPCVTPAGACQLWASFRDQLNKRGHAAIWRLEIQPRCRTERADIRGIAQPHWHIIGAAPAGRPGADIEWLKSTWLRVLGDRAAVVGAVDRAAVGEPCSSWSDGQRRYLFDHASKAKAEQIACGWGRHWGVVGKRRFVDDPGELHGLTKRELDLLGRLLRRWQRRRVIDRRGVGGVNWSCMSIEDRAGGCRVAWMGGGLWVPGASHNRLLQDRAFRRAVERQITRCQGAARGNVWALRGSRFKRSLSGQWFGASGAAACLAAARAMTLR